MPQWLTPVPLPASSAGDGDLGDQRDLAFMGATVTETAGVDASLKITNAAGTILLTRNLVANESITDWFGPDGIKCLGGMQVAITGAIEGSAFTR